MESSENEMAYFIIGLSIIVFIAGFYIDKINFANPKDKKHKHSHE